MRGLQEHEPLFDIGKPVDLASAFLYAEPGLFGPLQAGELVDSVHQFGSRSLAGGCSE